MSTTHQEDEMTETLAEFLLARIAEDESRQAKRPGYASKEAAALRARSRELAVHFWNSFPWRWLGRAWLVKLALPYADHADFRPEWRP